MAHGPRAVILAAGQGTRMRSRLPKVLHPLAGRPLIMYPVEVARAVTGTRPIVVIGPAHAAVAERLDGIADLVEQPQPRGTGDALRSVPAAHRAGGAVLVLSGDVPLLRVETVRAMLDRHRERAAACTLLTVVPEDPTGLGRVVRGEQGEVRAVVEERDLPPGGKAPAECNAGVYVFDGARLWPELEALDTANAQGEYYLTDVVARLAAAGAAVESVTAGDPREAMGVNDRGQLAAVEAVARRRVLDVLMLSGVTVADPATTYVDSAVRVGRDSVLHPMTVLRGETVLGEGCEIGPMAQLTGVRAGDGVRIGSSVLEDCELADGVIVGPWNRVRPGSRLAEGVELGTHAEVKNSRIGARSRVGHFSCVLDSDVGRDVNIGAGTVTCNYDGVAKHPTVIGDGAFVGSDSILVAPVSVGAGAYVGAGSVVSRDVPAGALAVERCEQRVVEGWAMRRRARQPAAAEEAMGDQRG